MNDLVLMIGTNVGDRNENINTAIRKLNNFFGYPTIVGSVYETEPWGYSSDSPYLNRAIVYNTDLMPFDILHICKSIEIDMGRRKQRDYRSDVVIYDNRIIDIDVILYGDMIFDEPYLKIPHRQLTERRFVLEPLAEIIPNYEHPTLHKTVKELFELCNDTLKVKKIDSDFLVNPFTSDINPAYSYIAIEGCIGAGKTTLSTMIAKDFHANLILEQFDDNPFLAMFYQDQEKYAFPVELSFLAARYKQLSTSFIGFDLFHRFTVADYFLPKSLIFAGKTLPIDMFKLYSSMFNIMESKLPEPELIVYLYLSLDNLLANIKKRARSYEMNISPDYLKSIQDGYLEYFKMQTNKRILLINTNDLDFVKNESDYRYLCELITQPWQVGVNRIGC